MTKRYYYTYPLEAAFMAREYGMRFVEPPTCSYNNGGIGYLDYEWFSSWFNQDGLADKADPPLYVHPDSEHLLEPRVGDVIQFYWPEPTDKQVVMVLEDEDNATVYEQALSLDWVLGTHPMSDGPIKSEIIQRDGKAFHWPEVEEV